MIILNMEKDLNKEIQILANKYQAGEFQDVLKKSSVLLLSLIHI